MPKDKEPTTIRETIHSLRVSTTRAIAAGITFRNVKTSVKEIHDWWYSDSLTDKRRVKYEENPKLF